MKNNIFYIFILVCFLSRLSLAFLAKYLGKYLTVFTGIIGIGFFYNYFNYNVGDKGHFGRVVWWNDYRLVHGFNYLLFSVLAFIGIKNSWFVLLFDAILGLIFFLHNHYLSNK
tara:strand:- start:128 stop:466 length:339 start_codon:yes stop_codon:yes gene_type:complete